MVPLAEMEGLAWRVKVFDRVAKGLDARRERRTDRGHSAGETGLTLPQRYVNVTAAVRGDRPAAGRVNGG
jgi:hypothetical protein